MGFWNTLFGGTELSPEEEKKEQEAKNFDLLKYDGVKAMKMGQADYAVRCFQEALKLKDDLETHDYLSQTLLRMGRLDEAIAELQVLAKAEPDNAPIQKRIAQVAYMQEDYDTVGAIAMLTKAIAIEENYGDAYLLRGQILLGMGDTAGADSDAAWLTEHAGEHEDILLLRARVEAAKGNAVAAIENYGQVIELNPFSIEAFRERGQLRFNSGDKAGADQDLQKVLELDPNLLADVSGEYSAEGIEHRVKEAYSVVNPLGL